ncbi:MAG: hypothetical protein F6K14_15010 [Symploca sp. SIO2C1]|nr:hypothetical protein [Symploca sp. SIO2C1]
MENFVLNLVGAKAIQIVPSVVTPPIGKDAISRIDNYQSSILHFNGLTDLRSQ